MGLFAALWNLLVCKLRGHDWDDSVPSPPGMRFCQRCLARYPE